VGGGGGWFCCSDYNNTDCKILNIIITLLLYYYERTAKEGIERYLLFVDSSYTIIFIITSTPRRTI
jgi:hypothetical protein